MGGHIRLLSPLQDLQAAWLQAHLLAYRAHTYALEVNVYGGHCTQAIQHCVYNLVTKIEPVMKCAYRLAAPGMFSKIIGMPCKGG